MTMTNIVIRTATSTHRATAVAAVSVTLAAWIRKIAHIAVMGAEIAMRRIITTAICTCWISLVERVIRLGVEKRLISSKEKETTFRYTSPLREYEKWADT